ncbi:MAG: hypothetical protein AAF229_12755 [Pseudomonadota bacterium]
MEISHWMARAAIAAVLALSSATSSAEVFSDRCNGCTAQQKANVARQLAPLSSLPGVPHQAYIIDYHAETLVRFNLMVVHEPWDGLSYTVATPAPVPAEIRQQFAVDIAALKAAVQASEDISRDIPASVAASAFDYVGNSGIATRTHAWVTQSLGILERTAVYFAGFVRILKVDVQFVIPIRFPDGSTALIKFLGEVDGVMYWRTVDGQTRDADGNEIPAPNATLNGFSGAYPNEARSRRMRDYLRIWFTHLQCKLIANGNETILRCTRVTLTE